MSQQQLMQLFGGVGQIGLGSLLGTMNRPQGVQSTRASTTTASTRVTTNTSRPITQMVSSSASANDSPKTNGKHIYYVNNLQWFTRIFHLGDNKSSRTSDTSTSGSTTNTNNKIQLSDLQNFLSEIPTTTGTESVVQVISFFINLFNYYFH